MLAKNEKAESPASASKIEILEIRPFNGPGNVRAFTSIRVGGVTIHGAKIVRQPEQVAWLAMPDRAYTDAGGKQKWAAVVELTPDLRRRVNETVIAEWERRCSPVAPPQPVRGSVPAECGTPR